MADIIIPTHDHKPYRLKDLNWKEAHYWGARIQKLADNTARGVHVVISDHANIYSPVAVYGHNAPFFAQNLPGYSEGGLNTYLHVLRRAQQEKVIAPGFEDTFVKAVIDSLAIFEREGDL